MDTDTTMAGRRVRLVATTHPRTTVAPGALGTVECLRVSPFPDAPVVVQVRWDDGGSLNLLLGHDRWEILADGAVGR